MIKSWKSPNLKNLTSSETSGSLYNRPQVRFHAATNKMFLRLKNYSDCHRVQCGSLLWLIVYCPFVFRNIAPLLAVLFKKSYRQTSIKSFSIKQWGLDGSVSINVEKSSEWMFPNNGKKVHCVRCLKKLALWEIARVDPAKRAKNHPGIWIKTICFLHL